MVVQSTFYRAGKLHCLLLYVLFASSVVAEPVAYKQGAALFVSHCALCHGSAGMGDGLLVLAIEGYPSTDLYDEKKRITVEAVKKYLQRVEPDKTLSALSPPWGDALTQQEINSLAKFVNYMRHSPSDAIDWLQTVGVSDIKIEASFSAGNVIYKTRCKVCHGDSGQGDGQLSQVINNPKPFNLSLSRADDAYLTKIIQQGGSSVQRSPSMPPWGEELSEVDVQSVILKIKAFRQSP